MRPLTLFERFRLTITLSEGPALWVAIVGISCVLAGIMGLFVYFRTPTGSAVDQTGTIVSMGNWATDYGNEPRAAVRLPDGLLTSVTLERTHHCRVGDAVTVRIQPQRWGISHSVHRRGCNT